MADTDAKLKVEQEFRAKLRDNFLRSVSEMMGESCEVITYERSSLKATFSGWMPDGTEILVRNLKTPAAVQLDAALLRTPDILYINFDRPLSLP